MKKATTKTSAKASAKKTAAKQTPANKFSAKDAVAKKNVGKQASQKKTVVKQNVTAIPSALDRLNRLERLYAEHQLSTAEYQMWKSVYLQTKAPEVIENHRVNQRRRK